MEEIYKLKNSGLTFAQIAGMVEPKITTSCLVKRLKKYCKENDLKYPLSKPGRKKIDIRVKKEVEINIHPESR